MTQLKTAKGTKVFTAVIETQGVTLHKVDGKVLAKLDGVTIGEVRVGQVLANGKEVKVSALVPEIDVKSLVGKDPLSLTHEELVALTIYLQSQSGAAPAVEADEEDEVVEEKPAKSKDKAKKKPAPAPVAEEDEDEEDEEDAFELPAKYNTYEKVAALGVKAMWAEIGKHIAAEAGIKARTPKDEMLEAIAEYFELEPAEEEEAPKAKAKAKSKSKPAPDVEEEDDEEDEEDEDDLDDEDEDDFDDEDDDEDDEEDDFDDEDEEDDEEFDDEDDEDDEDEDDEDEDDEEEDEVTEEDVDALFEAGNKAAIVAFCKRYDISLPKKKMNANTIKEIIKDALFG